MKLHYGPATLLALAACSQHARLVVVRPSSLAETVSLLGDTLYSVPLDAAGGPERVRRLNTARTALEMDSTKPRNWIELGRSTAAVTARITGKNRTGR